MNSEFHPAGGRLLSQSILKNIRRRPEGVIEGAAVGNDASVVKRDGGNLVVTTGAAAAGWFPPEASLSAGEAAWITAKNQMAAADAVPDAAEVILTYGEECPEQTIRREMKRLSETADREACPIIGGNTTGFGPGADCLIQIVMMGHQEHLEILNPEDRRKPGPGDVIFFLGETGIMGAELLAAGIPELRDHFSEGYIREMRSPRERFSIAGTARKAISSGAVYLHDVSYGGVYAALYQIAEAAGAGIAVSHEGLTIRQSTVELSEALNINPYMLLGTGAFFAAVPEDRADAWEEMMAGEEISVSRAGVITKEKARVVRAEAFPMERFLNLPDGDAIDSVLRTR